MAGRGGGGKPRECPRGAHNRGALTSSSLVRTAIVREISRALASRGVDVEKLSTGSSSARMAGGPLFRANAERRIPPGLDVDALC